MRREVLAGGRVRRARSLMEHLVFYLGDDVTALYHIIVCSVSVCVSALLSLS